MKIDSNKVSFRFNDYFMTYEELIFQPNHGLDMNIYEVKNDESYKKIYNQNWFWYVNPD
ncbi:MAG: hypothetical protein KF732_11275 [Flavobacteriales bacterium]|nr:hypothetical protein [Flavobacteriales bacterium]MBX2960523.1 hypothetical protein [Flavobacteriales bacterium]